MSKRIFQEAGPESVFAVPSSFKSVLLIVTGLTILSYLGLGVLAVFGGGATKESEVTVLQRYFLNACSFGWQAGFGALLGLIGGKVTQ